jgi:hypothetical protein
MLIKFESVDGEITAGFGVAVLVQALNALFSCL